MANICAVSLIARGFKTKSDLNRFVRILTENTEGELWLPYFDVYSTTREASLGVCGGKAGWNKGVRRNFIQKTDAGSAFRQLYFYSAPPTGQAQGIPLRRI